jgi:hypothetical protein
MATSCAIEGGNPTTTSPLGSSDRFATSRRMFSIDRTSPSASARNRSPASVTCTPRAVRKNSSTPNSSSSALICRLSAGWAMCSLLAARPKLPADATPRK